MASGGFGSISRTDIRSKAYRFDHVMKVKLPKCVSHLSPVFIMYFYRERL